jgi:putative copper export protein
MELLLNLAWVMLALPGYWLWRRAESRLEQRRLSSLQVVLALGCVLVLLFPVISASDDLHAMRAEMEDSSVSKRAVRQAGGERSSTWAHRLQGAAAATGLVRLVNPEVGWLDVAAVRVLPLARCGIFCAGRAPPFSLLG